MIGSVLLAIGGALALVAVWPCVRPARCVVCGRRWGRGCAVYGGVRRPWRGHRYDTPPTTQRQPRRECNRGCGKVCA